MYPNDKFNGVVFECELCDRTFKSKDSANRHKRINHQNTDASPAEAGQGGSIAGNSLEPELLPSHGKLCEVPGVMT